LVSKREPFFLAAVLATRSSSDTFVQTLKACDKNEHDMRWGLLKVVYRIFAAFVFFAASLVSPALAQQPSLEAAKVTVEQAKQCDQNVAQSYPKLMGKQAEIVAGAAFDKCVDIWTVASKNMIDALTPPAPSPADMNKNAFLLSTYLRSAKAIADQNDIEAWRQAELRRLMVIVLEARLNGATR
jgi:hypothetical protein